MSKHRRISEMTPEQAEYLPIYREEMRAKALRGQWASDDQMRDAVRAIYAARGLAEPVVLVFGNPVLCLMARSVLQLGDQLGAQLWDQLRGQLRGQLGDQLGDHDLHQTLWFAGGSEAYWISFYAYGHHIGATYDAASGAGLRAWDRYAEICGPLYPYDGIAFVSRRPDTQFDDARRLHCETGPAMRFDGYGVYAWHGVRIPAAWIEGRATLDPAEVLRTENVEQRHAGLQIIGWARVAEVLGCRVIDSDPDPQHGDLIELTIPGLPRPGRFLRAECPRNGTICEGVPYTSTVDGSPIESVLAAQAWRVRRTPATFTYPEIRT